MKKILVLFLFMGVVLSTFAAGNKNCSTACGKKNGSQNMQKHIEMMEKLEKVELKGTITLGEKAPAQLDVDGKIYQLALPAFRLKEYLTTGSVVTVKGIIPPCNNNDSETNFIKVLEIEANGKVYVLINSRHGCPKSDKKCQCKSKCHSSKKGHGCSKAKKGCPNSK